MYLRSIVSQTNSLWAHTAVLALIPMARSHMLVRNLLTRGAHGGLGSDNVLNFLVCVCVGGVPLASNCRADEEKVQPWRRLISTFSDFDLIKFF